SCAAIRAIGKPSGSYEIDPDGAGGDAALTVTCDNDAEGGGWTLIFTAPANLESAPVTYTTSTPRLLADATMVLIGFRDSPGSLAPAHAVFALPGGGKGPRPFAYPGADVPTAVSVDGGSPMTTMVRFGYGNFANTCDDPWRIGRAFGRVCIVGTSAPFFTA